MASRIADEPDRQDGTKTDDAITCTIHGNRLTVLEHGPDLRDALISLIDEAQHSLKVCYYIFDSDASGRLILARLMCAVRWML